jgi:PAS domain-containing protein
MTQIGFDGASSDLPVVDQQNLTRLLDELPDAAIVIDAQGTVQWANRTAEPRPGPSG